MSAPALPNQVLVADDDADIRTLVSLALRSAGFVAHTVGGGVEALHEARSGRHSVVVLDVRMGDMSGLDVCRQLKAEPTSAEILMISANSTTEDVAAGYAAGADDYLPKPFSPRELVHRVTSLLERHAVHHQSGTR